MRIDKIIQCIDTHSCGEPTRVVLGGIPRIIGKTMKDKYGYFKANFDGLRTALFQEPRGNPNMLGAFVIEPTQNGTDFGVIYAGATQYFEMCGDSTFSVAKVLAENQMIEVKEPITKIRLDTYAGIVEVEVRVDHGLVSDITYRSVPAFFLKTANIEVPNLGTVSADIAFGGLWYSFVEAGKVDLQIAPPNLKRTLELGMTLLGEINRQVKLSHPEDPKLNEVALVTFYEKQPRQGVDYKIANVYGDSSTCRSPAGTMSAARAAISYSIDGLQKDSEILIENGWTGSKHRVSVIEETRIGDLQGIVPELTATAYITGMYQAIVECEDPNARGFLL